MKIAVITEDGKTISQHFGRAAYYLVATLADGQIVGQELRDKLGHNHFANQSEHTRQPGEPHGMGAGSHDKHLQMTEAIADCTAIICGGMGMGAYQSMLSRGIQPFVTEILDIEQAARLYAEGKLINRSDRLH